MRIMESRKISIFSLFFFIPILSSLLQNLNLDNHKISFSFFLKISFTKYRFKNYLKTTFINYDFNVNFKTIFINYDFKINFLKS